MRSRCAHSLKSVSCHDLGWHWRLTRLGIQCSFSTRLFPSLVGTFQLSISQSMTSMCHWYPILRFRRVTFEKKPHFRKWVCDMLTHFHCLLSGPSAWRLLGIERVPVDIEPFGHMHGIRSFMCGSDKHGLFMSWIIDSTVDTAIIAHDYP